MKKITINNKEYKPFDFTSKEDRDVLRNKWVVKNGSKYDFPLAGFDNGMVCVRGQWMTSMFLLKNFTFSDGSPCGKEVVNG